MARPESPRAAENRALLAGIRRVHARHRGRYGAPRIHAALRAEGRLVSRGRVERLMHRHGIRATTQRRFRVVTTDSNHSLPVADNLLDQTFLATRPNQIWLADITYIPTDEGWLYLATVLDLFTRKVGAVAMRDHMGGRWPGTQRRARREGGSGGSSITQIAEANTQPPATAKCSTRPTWSSR